VVGALEALELVSAGLVEVDSEERTTAFWVLEALLVLDSS
tara:strand:- start:28 stop:147 length:120 start_codon:yes stop_codon:yes gene_type:complete